MRRAGGKPGGKKEPMKRHDVIRLAIDTQNARTAAKLCDTLRFVFGWTHARIMEDVRAAGRDPNDFEALLLEGDDDHALVPTL